MKVIKRDGRIEDFDGRYITFAIDAAEKSMPGRKEEKCWDYSMAISKKILSTNASCISVEKIQDYVVEFLKANDKELSDVYEAYRAERTAARERKGRLFSKFRSILGDDPENVNLMRENANIKGGSPMGRMLRIGSESSKQFYLLEPNLIPHQAAKMHSEGLIHIHDLDFYATTLNCLQLPLSKVLSEGFSTGHGSIRPPKDIRTAAALACIVIQSNQNDMFGGQSIPDFEYALAPYVSKTFEKHKSRLQKYCSHLADGGTVESVAWELTEQDTFQAMEALIHNLNTMNSRAGAQVPFSSINYGTGTTKEQRLIIKSILMATERGLGHGETPIFPVQVFKVKEGVNFYPGDPNYDLFELSVKVSAKRLFPNWEFLDAPFNLKFYKKGDPDTEVATMGCRTRVMANRHGASTTSGRGNLSFTSINLPRIAIEAHGDVRKFMQSLREMVEIVTEQLYSRFELQGKIKVKDLPFLFGQNLYMGSEKLGLDDEIRPALMHGTLGIGFVGLAEALVALTGHHHGENEAAQKLGLEIVGELAFQAKKASEIYDFNFSLIGSPAESTAGAFLRADRAKYGIIPGVTDREYYTNSSHVPVYYHISAADKIRIEAPYHALENGGHIAYVELDGDTAKNPEAVMTVVRYMEHCGIGYGAVNHPVDRDPVCGYVGVIGDICPRCGRREGESVSEEKIRELRKKYGSEVM